MMPRITAILLLICLFTGTLHAWHGEFAGAHSATSSVLSGHHAVEDNHEDHPGSGNKHEEDHCCNIHFQALPPHQQPAFVAPIATRQFTATIPHLYPRDISRIPYIPPRSIS
ncbi:hypothetical protein [Trichlorobacter lovleyi]|uniref:hypothetical protein n=1 Tax=Trichlorobacter lovleyi TaxID=313985 RepID=UPI003D0FAF45